MAIIAVGILVLLDLFAGGAVRASAYVAVPLTIVALGLLVGTWFGRARWLIALGLVLALALAVTAGAERIHREIGPSAVTAATGRWHPIDFAQLQPRYDVRYGDADLDLRSLDFAGRSEAVTLAVHVGNLTVHVPPEVDVDATVDLTAANADILGQQWSGADDNRSAFDPGIDGSGGGRVHFTIRVWVGNVVVSR